MEINYPPDPDRNRANTVDVRRRMAVRTLTREGTAKIKIKRVLDRAGKWGAFWDGA